MQSYTIIRKYVHQVAHKDNDLMAAIMNSVFKDHPSGKRRKNKILVYPKQQGVMGIHQSTVILLLLLCVSSFTHGQPANVMRRYQKFLSQHRGPYVNREMCTSEIRVRNIVSETGDCKPVNTFIQAQDDTIKAVCSGGTRLYYNRNLFRSSTPFSVVTCRYRRGSWPNCEYYTGKLSTRSIVLACDQGLPVHYENM
ncbi:hypothetical protein QQF64_020008 [Cirrhinus molitorella]|uniref:Ribonuclease A-domain domain-containing protein n=1 Tax=Cirrhinus molitorella TaxID=172907 RepID=A0ABR3LH35_9TELE